MSHLLLSASSKPPTIYISNLRLDAPPILLHPQCSSSAVVAADFHPEHPNVFVLAFTDGTSALYDASRMFQDHEHGRPADRSLISTTSGEIGHLKRLHAIGSKSSGPAQTNVTKEGDFIHDALDETASITAVALVPGYKVLAITVGIDGKCCVVDFVQRTRIRAWHLRRPATSLSVLYHATAKDQLDGPNEGCVPASHDYCIAVGRQDGKVLLFDLGGKPLGKEVLDPKGAKVVDVEWARKEIDLALSQKFKPPSIHTSMKAGDQGGDEPTADGRLENLPSGSTPPPPVPPRPTPKAGGKLSMRRAQTARNGRTRSSDLNTIQTQRSSASETSSSRKFEQEYRPTREKPASPRSPPKESTWKTRPREPANYVAQAPLESVVGSADEDQATLNGLSTLEQTTTSPHKAVARHTVDPPNPLASSYQSFKTAPTHVSASSASDTSNDTVVAWSTAASSRRPEPSLMSIAPPDQPSYFPERPSRTKSSKFGPTQTVSTRNPKTKKGHESISITTSPERSSSIFATRPKLPLSSLSISDREQSQRSSGGDTDSATIIQWPSFTFRKSPRVADLAAAVESATASILDSGAYAQENDDKEEGDGINADGQRPGSEENQDRVEPSTPLPPGALPRSPPPPLPPRNPPTANSPFQDVGNESEKTEENMGHHTCNCTAQLTDTLHTEMMVVREQLRRELAEQREWIVRLVEEVVQRGRG